MNTFKEQAKFWLDDNCTVNGSGRVALVAAILSFMEMGFVSLQKKYTTSERLAFIEALAKRFLPFFELEW